MSDEPVTLADVEAILARRLELGNADPEAGHGMDDDLLLEVARTTANGNPEAQAIAQTVVAFYDDHDDFERWYG